MSPSKLKSYLGKYPDFGLRVFAEVSWLEEPWFDPSPNVRVQVYNYKLRSHCMIWIGKLVSNNKILIQASSKERDSRPLFLFQSSPQVKDPNDSHMAFPRILIGPLYHPSAFNASNYQEKWLIMSDARTITFTTIL